MACAYTTDPLMDLMNSKTAEIRQRIELTEILTGCETPNQYYVFSKDQEGNKKYLFKAKEESGCCARNFCSGDSRGFKLHLRKIGFTSQMQEKKEDYVLFDRPTKCTCCCCDRPEMIGRYVKDGSPAGRIVQPFTCCNPLIEICTKDGRTPFSISANCCQCGYCCRNNTCGRCSEVDFEIYAGKTTNGPVVGNIHKKFKGCASMVGDADFFSLTFPKNANPEERLLLVNAVIMMDYLYYEDKDSSKSGRNRNRSRGGRHG